jgi:hypothetical protein
MRIFPIICVLLIIFGCNTTLTTDESEFKIHNLVIYVIEDQECAENYISGQDILWNCDHYIADVDAIPDNQLLMFEAHLTDPDNKASVVHSNISSDKNGLESEIVAELDKIGTDFPDHYSVAILAIVYDADNYTIDMWFDAIDGQQTPVYTLEFTITGTDI